MIFPIKTITPGTISYSQYPSSLTIDFKPKESKIAAMDKRTFPLNCMPRKLLETSKPVEVYTEQVPEFMDDFVKDTKKYHHRAKSCVNSFRKKQVMEAVKEPAPAKKNTRENKNYVPKISFRMFRRNESLKFEETDGFYKPHVVNISQRSKLTLYSAVPMNLRPHEYKPRRLKSANKNISSF